MSKQDKTCTAVIDNINKRINIACATHNEVCDDNPKPCPWFALGTFPVIENNFLSNGLFNVNVQNSKWTIVFQFYNYAVQVHGLLFYPYKFVSQTPNKSRQGF